MHGESQSFSKDPKMNRNQHLTDWWFGTCFIVPYIGNNNQKTDELHHFSEGYTTNQIS